MKNKLTQNNLSKEIKKRKEAEKNLHFSEKHFQILVEGIKDYAIFFMDQNGKVMFWNNGAKHLIGYATSEVIGKNLSQFFIPEDRKLKKPQIELKTALAEGRADDENWILRKNGSKFWASGITTAIKDKKGNLLYLAKIIHDLTSYKELDERKNYFLSMASHELKTPVTSIKVYIEYLQKQADKFENQVFQKILNRTHSQIINLTILIEDLVSVTRLQSGRLELHNELFDFDTAVQEVIENYQATIKTHSIIQTGKTRQKIYGDKYRIGQVVLNFLSNAAKYSPSANKIFVTLLADGKNVTCSVEDFGIGISKADKEKVFERFFRSNGKDEHVFPGMGLGLYIASEIIKLHKGKIRLTSTLGKGSVFSFSLSIPK
ncbi:MAG TPA: PAS domain-containing sensor histidine kinase [Candidatus Saccharimonadales bacterium]|nr:PAS domain-containing sensor histidine kinase [Candidatus Saccharimonadales bacterium]